MSIKDFSLEALEAMVIGLVFAWTLTVAVALVQPSFEVERRGTVEIYSLTAEPSGPSA